MAVRKAYSIGFVKHRAKDFFETLRDSGIQRLIDVRLNNSSQLAGFTKREDLPYFLNTICGIEYTHNDLLAPTKEILDGFKKLKGAWEDYETVFQRLMTERRIETQIDPSLFDIPTVLLCSEETAENCHRRLVLEYLNSKWGDLEIVHI